MLKQVLHIVTAVLRGQNRTVSCYFGERGCDLFEGGMRIIDKRTMLLLRFDSRLFSYLSRVYQTGPTSMMQVFNWEVHSRLAGREARIR
jgi:hypothetical protein